MKNAFRDSKKLEIPLHSHTATFDLISVGKSYLLKHASSYLDLGQILLRWAKENSDLTPKQYKQYLYNKRFGEDTLVAKNSYQKLRVKTETLDTKETIRNNDGQLIIANTKYLDSAKKQSSGKRIKTQTSSKRLLTRKSKSLVFSESSNHSELRFLTPSRNYIPEFEKGSIRTKLIQEFEPNSDRSFERS
jgi:hypothetical protein